MKKINQKIITSIFIFFIVLLLSISIILANDVSSKKNTEINEEKIYYQIKYFDNKIVYMLDLLKNDETQINWEELKKYTNNLYNYWNSTILDLNNLDINKNYLTDFGKKLDDLTLSIKYQNKKSSTTNLLELYSKLIIYIDELNYIEYSRVLSIKYNLLLASSAAGVGNWTLAHEYILKASENIFKLVNTVRINEYEQYNVNQAYVSVKEMENIINIKDIDVFNIKYKIALDKLENL